MTTAEAKHNGRPLLWPPPRHLAVREGVLVADGRLTIRCDPRFSEEVSLFAADWARAGVSVERRDPPDGGSLLPPKESGPGDEAYLLRVTPDGVGLGARTAHGAFNGLQALAQMIASADRRLPCLQIEDSPFKAVRGVHFYIPPRAHLEWFRRFVDFLARYRYNTVFLEVGAAMQFESHPEINTAWERFCADMMVYPGGPDANGWGDGGMQMTVGHIKNSVHIENGGRSYLSKAELSELVRYMKRRHIEVIPEVQTLSHSYWLLMAHPECAERSDDPYPDTYCPSNPRTYEIAFDCMEEIVDVVKPKTVSLGHDEWHSIGICERCRERTGHDLLAEDILRYHAWLKERGIRTHMWGDKFLEIVKMDEREIGMPVGGMEYISFNQRTRKPEVVRPTWRAVDMIPGDILIGDWYYTMTSGEDTGSQDYFAQRGLDVVFGNFHPSSFPNVEDRLRRPNVLGAEVSLWHETSEHGVAMTDALVRYLDAANALWNRSYESRLRGEYNRTIAMIYPAERDRMNGRSPRVASERDFVPVDISAHCNAPIMGLRDYRAVLGEDARVPGSVPFEIRTAPLEAQGRRECVQVGQGAAEKVAAIGVNGHYGSLVFLHSYTHHLGGPPTHPCTYIGAEEDVVGRYVIHYRDGTVASAPLEYSRVITALDSEFGAARANPIYQRSAIQKVVERTAVSKRVRHRVSSQVVFAYEWENPFPEKEISSIDVEHDPAREGAIALFGITGCKS